jgi:tetratricopeptide (TPR) repeat protein
MKKNKIPRVAALIVGSALAAVIALAPASSAFAQAKQQPSRAAAKPLKAAGDAMRAKKYDVVEAKLKEVDALPERSPYDEFLVHEMRGFLDVHAKNYTAAEKDLEAVINSNFVSQSEVPVRVRELAVVSLTLKDYSKAIDYGTRAVKGGYADDNTYVVLEQAYYLKGDNKATLKYVGDFVDAEIKAGKTPKERSLKTIMATCVALKDHGCETRAFERLVSYYPKGDYWANLLNALFSDEDYKPDEPRLQLYRLAFDVNVLKNPADYIEMAQLEMDQGAAGEAARVLQKGIDANVFTEQRDKDKNGRLLAAAQKRAAVDQAALAQTASEAASTPTGPKAASLGLILLAYQQYPQAVDALNRALKIGGLTSVPSTQLLLGIAELKAGNKDAAVKTFHAVKGDQKYERLANLWALHARQV